MSWRVLATARNFRSTPAAVALLEDAGCVLVRSEYGGPAGDHALGGEELIALLRDADAYVAGSAHVTRAVLEAAPKLKIVSRRGVGYENIDLDAARERNIVVAIAAGANRHAVADLVFALLLAAARRVPDAHCSVSEGRWEPFSGPELYGKTMGIVGLGRVGKGVAQRARGFSMTVLACDPVRDEAFARTAGVAYVELDELLARADVVSINADLNSTSRLLLGRAAFARMKEGVLFVNASRGGIVDEAALAQALRDGKVRAAGIDVFDEEPPRASPLVGLPNVVLSPHVGAYSDEATDAANLMAARSVVGYMNGVLPAPDCIVS